MIADFLRGSFGAFQQRLHVGSDAVDAGQVEAALRDLHRHSLVSRSDARTFELTELGRLAGQAGVEVESITRLVDALWPLSAAELNDPTLIAATQLTVELDDVRMPLNKKSTQKEPDTWFGYLGKQSVASGVIHGMRRGGDGPQATLRAKRAAACLLWMSDLPLLQIEDLLTQHGGLGGAAGAVRSTASRTFDLLGTTMRVAAILHSDLLLEDRGERLLARLEVGVSAAMVEVALIAGGSLSRSNYQALQRAGMTSIEALDDAGDEALAECCDRDPSRVDDLRDALRRGRPRERINQMELGKQLPDYQG